MEPLLLELRRATRTQHDRIEAVLRLDRPMPRERYAAVLGGFQAFLAQWEPAVARALPARLRDWFEPRRRASFAAHDLQVLAQDASGGNGFASATARHVADRARHAAARLSLEGLPALFGSLYVIEGSALGGQVIAHALERDMGLSPGHGASYFHGHGERTAAMWREFRQCAVAEVGSAPQDLADAGRSARDTFEALIDAFGPIAPAPVSEPLADGEPSAGMVMMPSGTRPSARAG